MKKLIEQKFTQELSALYLGVRVTTISNRMKESEKGRYMIEDVKFEFEDRDFYEERNCHIIPSYEIVFTVNGAGRRERVTFYDVDSLPKINQNLQSFESLATNAIFFDHSSGEVYTKNNVDAAVATKTGNSVNFALNDRVQPL